MAVSHKGAISFGLVHIPVALYVATQDNDIHFNQICKEDGSRVKYKKICSNCGKEVGTDGIVKGFEYEKGKYVILTDEDFEKAKTEKDRTIQILHFTDLSQIQPIYYDKTYHVLPEAGGEKAYQLLRQAMKQENKVAIAKTVIGTKEKLLTILPTDNEILVETMFFYDEIKEIPKEIPKADVTADELSIAKTLIQSMDKPFEPQLYHNEYQQRLREIIEMKINGQEVVMPDPQEETNVINLMDALQASLEQAKNENPKKPRRKKAAKGA